MARLGPSGLAQLFREIANYVSTRLSNYNTKAELDSLLDAKANDNNVIHTSGDETITGSKTFMDTIISNLNFYNTSDVLDVEIPYIAIGERTNGVYKPSVNWKDKDGYILGGVSVGRTYSQDTTASLSATTKKSDGTLVYPEVKVIAKSDGISHATAPTPSSNATGNEIVTAEWVIDKGLVDDSNVVHRSGDETIDGTKMFSNTIHRYADLTTSGGAEVYRFDDTNANSCGHIYNNTYWTGDTIYNVHGAYNAKSGKSMQIGITSNDAGVGIAYIDGSATNGNLESVTSITEHNGIATMGWVNNPATSTNVVHRSGEETISGAKIFTESIYKKNSTLDLQVNPSSDQFNSFLFTDKNNVAMCYLEHVQTTTGVNALGLITRDKNNESHGIQVTSENNVIPLGNGVVNLGLSGHKWKNVYATTFNGNLKGNADTATSAGNGVDSCGGSWIRFKSGIQICWGGNAHEEIISYPKAFHSRPALSCTPTSAKEYSLVVNYHLNTNTQFACSLWNIQTNTAQPNSYFTWIAIGIWK